MNLKKTLHDFEDVPTGKETLWSEFKFTWSGALTIALIAIVSRPNGPKSLFTWEKRCDRGGSRSRGMKDGLKSRLLFSAKPFGHDQDLPERECDPEKTVGKKYQNFKA